MRNSFDVCKSLLLKVKTRQIACWSARTRVAGKSLQIELSSVTATVEKYVSLARPFTINIKSVQTQYSSCSSQSSNLLKFVLW